MEAPGADLPQWRLHMLPRGQANIFAILHRPQGAGRQMALYVPGSIEGAILNGRHDYNPLARALGDKGISLMVLQMSQPLGWGSVRSETS